jgi:predicted transcriptional regulator
VKILLSVQAKDFLVMDNGKVKGTLGRDEIIKALSEKGGDSPVGEAMNKEFKVFKTEDEADKLFHEVHKRKQNIFPVFDDGTLAGAVDTDNITELLLVSEAKRILKESSERKERSL